MNIELRRLAIRGLMSLRDVVIEPGPITVLIGPNGAGKSNLLTVFELLAHLRAGTLALILVERGPASSLLHYGPKNTAAIDLELDFAIDGATALYRVRLAHTPGDDGFVFQDETVGWHSPDDSHPTMFSLGSGHRETALDRDLDGAAGHSVRQLRRCLAQISYFHFHDTSARSSLRTAAREADTRALRSDGSNLAPYLLGLQEAEPGSTAHNAGRRINHLIARVAPSIKTLAPSRVGRDSVRLDWIDDRDEVFGPSRLSDGTLRTIALITALSQPAERLPGFISIDEPELGLHPAALGVLAALVRSVSHRSQVLLATQSPALLDLFTAEEVLVTERSDGASQFRRLNVASLKSWLDDYRLSELYDRNLLGGRP